MRISLTLFGRLDTVELSRQIRKCQVAAHSLGQAPRRVSPSQTTGGFACPAGTEKSSDHPTRTFGGQRLASSSRAESQLPALPEPQVSVWGGDPLIAPPGGEIAELIMEELNFLAAAAVGALCSAERVPAIYQVQNSPLSSAPQGGGAARLLVFGGVGPDRVFMQDNYFNDLQLLDVQAREWCEVAQSGAVGALKVCVTRAQS